MENLNIEDESLRGIELKLQQDRKEIFSIMQFYTIAEIEDIINNQKKSLELGGHSDESIIRTELIIEVGEKVIATNKKGNE